MCAEAAMSRKVTLVKGKNNMIGISIGGGAPMCPVLYVVQVNTLTHTLTSPQPACYTLPTTLTADYTHSTTLTSHYTLPTTLTAHDIPHTPTLF